MSKIPTVEEFFKKYSDNTSLSEGHYDYLVEKDSFKEAMIEFAKLHCEAQLKAILEKVRVREDELNPRNTEKVKSTYIGIEFEADKGYEDYCPYKYTVDKNSIINAYDLNNIK